MSNVHEKIDRKWSYLQPDGDEIERLERFSVENLVKKMQRRSGGTTPSMGAVLQRRTNLRFVYSQQLRREKAKCSREEAKFLRCMFSNGVDLGFRRKIR